MPILTRTTRYTSRTDVAAVLPVANNLIAKSQELDNVVWFFSPGLTSITPNAAVAPDSTTTAEKVVETNGSAADKTLAQTGFTIVSGANYTWSIYCKAAERDEINLTVMNADFSGGFFSSIFDLSSETWSGAGGTFGVGATYLAHAFLNVGNGWYRVSVSGSLTTTAARVNLDVASGGNINYVGDGVSGYYAWGGQLETGTSASNYVATL